MRCRAYIWPAKSEGGDGNGDNQNDFSGNNGDSQNDGYGDSGCEGPELW